jgi:transposase, IS5 family
MKQQTLAMAADQGGGFERYRRATKRDVFLATMNEIVPWSELCKLIEPHYPKPGNGRPPVGLQRMLRMYFVQHWFNLADEACEEALLDSTALRRFVGIDLGRERVPDGTTLLKFRRLLEDNDLGEQLFATVGQLLQARGLKVGTGTIVDATIIGAPSSTKNADKQRDPEMHQTRKGQQWCVSRTQAADLWCCTEDGSWPPEAGLQEQASNHPVLLRSKGAVVSDRAKVIPSGVAGTY